MLRSGWSFCVVVLVSSSALAAPRRVAVEADPFPFLDHGYSVHLATKPDAEARLRVGFGFFGYDASTPSGDNAGFEVRVDAFEGNVGVFPLNGVLRGAFAGLYLFEERYRYRRSDVDREARRHFLIAAPALGYQLMPWRSGPYLMPWAALGVPLAKSGSSVVGDRSYDESKVFPVLAVHLGWEFAVL